MPNKDGFLVIHWRMIYVFFWSPVFKNPAAPFCSKFLSSVLPGHLNNKYWTWTHLFQYIQQVFISKTSQGCSVGLHKLCLNVFELIFSFIGHSWPFYAVDIHWSQTFLKVCLLLTNPHKSQNLNTLVLTLRTLLLIKVNTVTYHYYDLVQNFWPEIFLPQITQGWYLSLL